MAQELKDLKPGEVSFVDRGANGRRFAITKADDQPAVDASIVTALETAPEGEAELLAELQKADADESTVKATVGAFRLLKSAGEGISAGIASLFSGRPAEPEQTPVTKEETGMADGVPVKKDDGTWDLSGVPEAQRAGVEVILKAHDAQVDELRSEIEKRDERLGEAEQIAKAERDKRETAEYVAKAAELDKLSADPADFGAVLKTVAGAVDAETFEKLEAVLKAANEAVAQGDLYAEFGRGGAAPTDAEARIEKAAEEIRKADTSLTREQAIERALADNPELYDEYRTEVR